MHFTVCAQCNVIMTSELFALSLRSIRCYWQRDQAAANPP